MILIFSFTNLKEDMLGNQNSPKSQIWKKLISPGVSCLNRLDISSSHRYPIKKLDGAANTASYWARRGRGLLASAAILPGPSFTAPPFMCMGDYCVSSLKKVCWPQFSTNFQTDFFVRQGRDVAIIVVSCFIYNSSLNIFNN